MIKTYLHSFGHALAGISLFLRTERNAKLHLAATAAVVALAFYLNVSSHEWLWIASAVAAVFITEMINTAIEKLCNRITTDKDPEIKVIKDISAGFVLIASFYALIVAAIIFSPYLF